MIKQKDIVKMFGDEIDSSNFTWDRYCGVVGIPIISIFDNPAALYNPQYKAIGWCRADKLPVRPRSQGIAIMFIEKTDEELFWTHVSDEFLETLLIRHSCINH